MNALFRHSLGLLAAVVFLNGGCPPSDTSVGATATSGTATSSQTPSSSAASLAGSTTGGGGDGGSGGCAPEPIPQGVPPGWIEYTDWSCKCRFYVPGSKAAMPSPIKWDKCPASPSGIDCQAMVIDWTADKLAVGLDAMTTRNGGTPILGFQKRAFDNSRPYLLKVIAEADGPVRAAMLKMWVKSQAESDPGCVLIQQALQDDKFIFSVLGDDAEGSWAKSGRKGAIGGSIDELHPHVLADYYDAYEDSWACSSSRVFRLTGPFVLKAYNWDMTGESFISSPAKDPEGLTASQLLASGDSFFWTTQQVYVAGINSWNAIDGARPFIRYIGDATRGAGNLGTDGASLVWSYGEGKKPTDENYEHPTRSIMSAPFTTDPAKLAPKRLRSDPSVAIGGQPFRVACGRAAHGGKTQPVVVVRLSDGVSWLFAPDAVPGFYADAVLGITCDHVYLFGEFGGRWNIARIRLDSLGPGLAPD